MQFQDYLCYIMSRVLFSSYLLINAHMTFFVVTAESVSCHLRVGVLPAHSASLLLALGFALVPYDCYSGLNYSQELVDPSARALLWETG